MSTAAENMPHTHGRRPPSPAKVLRSLFWKLLFRGRAAQQAGMQKARRQMSLGLTLFIYARKPAAPASAAPAKARVVKISESDNWDARLGFLMHDVSRLRRSVFDEFMKPMGLTRSQWWILAHLSRHDVMIQSDLANVLDLGKAALGGLLDRLESSRLIERRSDDTDRRVKRIYLTTRGTQAIQEMRVKSHEVSERILAGLDLDARRALADNLALVKSNLVALRAESGGR